MTYQDQQFRMHFDNKRVIEVCEDFIEGFGKEFLLDSRPLLDINQGENLRFIGKICKIKQYSRYSNYFSNATRYKNGEDLAIVNFCQRTFVGTTNV